MSTLLSLGKSLHSIGQEGWARTCSQLGVTKKFATFQRMTRKSNQERRVCRAGDDGGRRVLRFAMVEYRQNQRERKSEVMTQSRDFWGGRTSGTQADEKLPATAQHGYLMWRSNSLYLVPPLSRLKIKTPALISRLSSLSARCSSP
jgi:hypothetical protein